MSIRPLRAHGTEHDCPDCSGFGEVGPAHAPRRCIPCNGLGSRVLTCQCCDETIAGVAFLITRNVHDRAVFCSSCTEGWLRWCKEAAWLAQTQRALAEAAE